MDRAQLAIPPHFNAARVGEVWPVQYSARAPEAEDWARRLHLAPASQDQARTGLLLIDCQNTFCIPGSDLFVGGQSGTGAVDDNRRLCEFIYRNLHEISIIFATLDTHTAAQIFHPIFWVNARGDHPAGGQVVITLQDVESGAWRVNPAMAGLAAGRDLDSLQRHALHYTRRLSEGGKYPLMIWPYHAMLGGIGHSLAPAVEEAVFFHGIARSSQPWFEMKGSHPLTESYSALGPEVPDDDAGTALVPLNRSFLDALLGCDRLIIAGQASSHCVAWTVDDLLARMDAVRPGQAGSVVLLEDCMSPVVVPGVVDFSEAATKALQRFGERGAQVQQSATPMDDWQIGTLLPARNGARAIPSRVEGLSIT
jgi:nicotinamidase-related amidase